MNKNIIIAPSIRNQRSWYAFDLWQQEALSRVPIDELLLYFTDTVNPVALPYQAEEFDVLGAKGWDVAGSDIDLQRDLIKKGVLIHRYIGTPWAIEQVMIYAGFGAAALVEHTGSGSTGWAVFGIYVDIGSMWPDPALCEILYRLVMLYKNARSVFEGIVFTGLDFVEDSLLIGDDLEVDASSTITDGIVVSGTFYCDGTYLCDGSRNFDDELDTITITLV